MGLFGLTSSDWHVYLMPLSSNRTFILITPASSLLLKMLHFSHLLLLAVLITAMERAEEVMGDWKQSNNREERKNKWGSQSFSFLTHHVSIYSFACSLTIWADVFCLILLCCTFRTNMGWECQFKTSTTEMQRHWYCSDFLMHLKQFKWVWEFTNK